MTKIIPLALVFASISVMPALAAAAPALPAPKILVLDRNALLATSKAGQDIAKQMEAYGNQAKANLDAQAKSLQAQGQALQQQVAVLSADAKAAKIKEFDAKQMALQSQAQQKEASIQYSAIVARQQIANKLQPILQQLMNERGANMILDKQAVLMGNNIGAFDITQEAINRLNQQLPGLKVSLVSPPAPR